MHSMLNVLLILSIDGLLPTFLAKSFLAITASRKSSNNVTEESCTEFSSTTVPR